VGNPGTANGDWAVVSLNQEGARRVTNRLRVGPSITALTFHIPVNAFVFGVGQHTSWGGTVRATGQNIGMRDEAYFQQTGNYRELARMSGMVRVEPRSASDSVPTRGDSGGPIFTEMGQHATFLGVHSTSVVNQGRTTFWYFSPYIHAVNHFTPRTTP